MRIIQASHGDERGASAVEYALLVGAIAAVIVVVVVALGGVVLEMFSGSCDKITTQTTNGTTTSC